VFTEVVRALVPGEDVLILTRDPAMTVEASALLEDCGVPLERIQFLETTTDRIWTRDTGPILVRDNDTALALHWKFNGWAKYDDHTADQQVPPIVAKALGVPTQRPQFTIGTVAIGRPGSPHRPNNAQRSIVAIRSVDTQRSFMA
jgi:agmatine deiminase